jgi:hypothetical protein
MKLTDCTDLVAILIQLAAAITIYKNSPTNKPSGALIGVSNPDMQKPNTMNNWLKIGFRILVLGYLVQLCSFSLKQLGF